MQLTKETIRCKAMQLFIASTTDDLKQTDEYFSNFSNLCYEHKLLWLEMAKRELKNAKPNPT